MTDQIMGHGDGLIVKMMSAKPSRAKPVWAGLGMLMGDRIWAWAGFRAVVGVLSHSFCHEHGHRAVPEARHATSFPVDFLIDVTYKTLSNQQQGSKVMQHAYHGTMRVFLDTKMHRRFMDASFETVRHYCDQHLVGNARMIEITDDWGNTLAQWKPDTGWSVAMEPDGFIE